MQKSPEYPPIDVSRATRGRFLPRHKARVIEQDDLVIVEFVEQEPWYTATPARPSTCSRSYSLFTRLSLFYFAIFASSASVFYGLSKWLR